MMGGAISVASIVGEGSTFTFTAALPEADEVTRSVIAGVARGGSVLVLTDQRLARTELVSTLADAGLTVDVVVSTEVALDRLRETDSMNTPFSAIVVDAQRHGMEIAWELGRERRGVPMLLVTPGGNRGDAARCRELGVSGYLTGPVVAADIVDAVEAIVAGASELVTRHWLKERRRTLYVLIADDSETNRLMVTEVLEQRGHHVVAAGNGAEAVEAFERQVFDIALLDLHMPDSDGYAAARMIRKLGSHGRRIPIVAVSGSVSDAGRQRATEAGMNQFLAKPYVPEQLVEIVETLARVREPAA
jgi:CheY-like chemotaxis protein